MSTVAAVKHAGRVYMAADSGAWTGNETRVFAGNGKMHRTGDVLIGYAGALRTGQVMRHLLVPPELGETDAMDYMVEGLVPTMRALFEDQGVNVHGDEGDETTASFLVAVGGRVFRVGGDYCVFETSDAFDAIGGGGMVANAVLFATPGMEPHERLALALHAARHLTDAAREPFHFLAVP